MRTTMSVTLIVLVSKLIGYLRDAITAYYFGTGLESDAYYSAYTLYYFPILLFTSCISSTLIPMYLDARRRRGPQAADRFGSRTINLFALVSMVLSIIMYLAAEPIVRLVYPYFDAERLRMTTEMTRIMLPSLVFVTISIAQSSIMNANEHYLAGQLSGFPYSVVCIIAAVWFSAPFGINAIAWATAIAGLLQMLIIIPFQRGVFKYSFRFDFNDKRIKRMIILAGPSMASMAVNEVNHLIDRSMASGLNAGDITAMNYAYRLITFVIGVVIVPIITVMFSRMSKRAAENNHKAILRILMQCIEVIVLILLPIIAMGGMLNLDVIKLAYMRGAFAMDSVVTTAGIFLMYLIGVVFYGLRDLFNRGFHSIQNTKIPLYTSIITVVINVTLNWVLSRIMGARGLALATTISSAIGALLLFIQLRRKLGRVNYLGTLIEVIKCAIAACVCAILALVMNRLVPDANGTLWVLLRLIVCCAPCVIAYLGMLILLKARQLKFLKQMIHRR